MSTVPRRKFTPRARRFFRRRAYWLIIVAFLAAAVIWQNFPRRAVMEPAYIAVPAPPPAASRQVLLHYHATPLSAVLEDLARQAHIHFQVDWPVLKQSNVEPATPITIEASQPIALASAMAVIFQSIGPFDADFSAEPALVSSYDVLHAQARGVLVTYPIADLLRIEGPWQTFTGSRERGAALARVLEETVEPDDWLANGGRFADARIEGDNLTVFATPTMHYEIRELLDSLRSH